MARLKSTTIAGRLSVAGYVETRVLTINSKTVNNIADSITGNDNDASSLATAKAVYDYVQSLFADGIATYGPWRIESVSNNLTFTYTG